MGWVLASIGFASVSFALLAIGALCLDCYHQAEKRSLTSDPATWQRLSPCGTSLENQRDREAA